MHLCVHVRGDGDGRVLAAISLDRHPDAAKRPGMQGQDLCQTVDDAAGDVGGGRARERAEKKCSRAKMI